jgi:large subunit ribosomal protein L3
MAHAIVTDNRKNALTKGEDISYPITIIECPPLKLCAIKFYKKSVYGVKLITEVWTKPDKELARTLPLPKKIDEKKIEGIRPEDYYNIRGLVYTQPKLTGIGSKKPEVFEVSVGGSPKDQFNYLKERLGKDLHIEDIFKDGQLIDVHAVTKGKGFCGPVKRFSVSLRSHKSEKTKRGPASLGAWNAQGHIMYRVAHAGQMGFHTRTEHNKWILKIEKDYSKLNPNGGFTHYGVVKNPCILLKGSVQGPQKRIVRFQHAVRADKKVPTEGPAIQQIVIR